MDYPPVFNSQLGFLGAHGLMAFFGAITQAARAHREGQSKGFMDFFILTTMSSFSGIVFALVSFQFFQNPYMTLAITGAGGFLGVEGLTFISNKLRDVLAGVLSSK